MDGGWIKEKKCSTNNLFCTLKFICFLIFIIMSILEINHFTIITKQLKVSIDFYDVCLNLKEGPRPNLKFNGAWLYFEKKPIIHLVEGVQLQQGVIDHVALSVSNIGSYEKKLKNLGIEYKKNKLSNGINQIFFHDPNEAKIELNSV